MRAQTPLLAAFLSLCLACPAQEFEVARVKASDPNVPHSVGFHVYPGGRVVASALSLKTLIAAAFRVPFAQVSGGDAWIERDPYDIEAVPSETSRASIRDLRYTLFGIEDEQLCQMLQGLLIDRFQLKFHRETKTGDTWLLERNGKPLALHETPEPAFGSIGYAGGRWGMTATSMPQLARFASSFVLHAPVLDRTQTLGSFDYKQPVPDQDPNYGDPTDSFLRLIPELGLKLERVKGPIEVFVIDHAAKPSPN